MDLGPRVVTDPTLAVETPEKLVGNVRATQDVIDTESTASLDLSFTWTGSETRRIEFGANEIPFSNPRRSAPDGATAMLVTAETGAAIDRRDDRTWVPNDADEITTFLPLEGYTFDPGETASWSWQLWGVPGETASIEPGAYRFESRSGSRGDGDPMVTLSLSVEPLRRS
ncbi:hypothetical protein [Halorientalis sp. IM1011]|uniref:hypothetical protein n=1 Tax=Halorientalis sp. IM1011 TaxID=1932360 RepID=UPI0012F95240|nr:hypothetical protein [Halorientalis sp. IM1011]